MKILFVRHGESVDDLTDQYGGWADFHLTPKGKIQLQQTAKKIKDLNIQFEYLYTSPLWRAEESARIIANVLSIPLEISVYLKEKNGYGLLSGMNKSEAEERYPELVKDMKDGYVFGAEPTEKFIERVRFAVDYLTKCGKENIIAVTHGGFLNQLFTQILEKKFTKAHDGGFVLLEYFEGEFNILKVEGIDYE